MTRKVVTVEHILGLIKSGELKKAKKPNSGDVEYYDFSAFIIKDGIHYVPASYMINEWSGKPCHTSDREDVNAYFPKLEEVGGMVKVSFHSVDAGYYDSTLLEWYFDSLEDVLVEAKGDRNEES